MEEAGPQSLRGRWVLHGVLDGLGDVLRHDRIGPPIVDGRSPWQDIMPVRCERCEPLLLQDDELLSLRSVGGRKPEDTLREGRRLVDVAEPRSHRRELAGPQQMLHFAGGDRPRRRDLMLHVTGNQLARRHVDLGVQPGRGWDHRHCQSRVGDAVLLRVQWIANPSQVHRHVAASLRRRLRVARQHRGNDGDVFAPDSAHALSNAKEILAHVEISGLDDAWPGSTMSGWA